MGCRPFSQGVSSSDRHLILWDGLCKCWVLYFLACSVQLTSRLKHQHLRGAQQPNPRFCMPLGIKSKTDGPETEQGHFQKHKWFTMWQYNVLLMLCITPDALVKRKAGLCVGTPPL